MFVSQKDQYALLALFELAKRNGNGPVNAASIAEAQAIPSRFLQVILNELKQAGFVESRRGKAGGYRLLRDPAELTLGEVLRFLEGSFEIAPPDPDGRLDRRLVFGPIWKKATQAIARVFDGATFADLVEEEKRRTETYVPAYAI